MLGIALDEFWLLQPGLFDDTVAAWRILHGEKAAPIKSEINYDDDSIFDLV